MQNSGCPADGMYALVLTSGEQEVAGQAQVQDGAVNGSAGAYRLAGNVCEAGDGISGRMQVVLLDPQAPVLGMFKTVTLDLAGSGSENGFDLQGHANGHHVVRIRFYGRRIDAAQ